MSFLSRFFASLFGKSNAPKKQEWMKNMTVTRVYVAPLTPEKVNNIMARREKERLERIETAEGKLKDWLIAALKTNGNLEFSWESGNDEAFVKFEKYEEVEKENFWDLEEYIVDKLEIPDAGEFQMNGDGTIYIADGLVRIRYSSTMKDLSDFDEETETEVYLKEVQDSGDKVLFGI